MSKLNKEEVLAQFRANYLAKNGQEPEIEQKGSWFKVDGGKSVRLGDLADMAAELAGGAPAAAKPEQAKTEAPKAKPAAAKKAKPAAKAKSADKGGLSPKQLWAQKLAQGSKLPRGC